MRHPFYHQQTGDIRVTVRPVFLPDQSRPEQQQFVFSYSVRVENVGRQTAQLLARRWHIHDSIGEDNEVVGEGVVGEQPVISPGRVHEYKSFCVLKSGRGHMEGEYCFRRGDGTAFEAAIPRFQLAVDESDATRED